MRNVRILGWLLLALGIVALPAVSQAQVSVGISVRVGPPALPVYAQPICPGAGYIWTPGYWAWGPGGYYWVPGTWVIAPRVGFLWTPGYWGWGEGVYVWHPGYWGPHVGFYGGINYGFGYTGVGYAGGYWNHGVFAYNRAVNNVNVTVIHNTYNKTVIVNNTTVNRVSYNGGPGGIESRPSRQEEAAGREQHISPTDEQMQHRQAASANRARLASVNHGRPEFAATARPGEFNRPDVRNVDRTQDRPNPERMERPNERPNQRQERNNARPQAHPRENQHPGKGGEKSHGNNEHFR